MGRSAAKKFPRYLIEIPIPNQEIPLNDIGISLNEFNFLDYKEFLEIPGFLLVLLIILQYFNPGISNSR